MLCEDPKHFVLTFSTFLYRQFKQKNFNVFDNENFIGYFIVKMILFSHNQHNLDITLFYNIWTPKSGDKSENIVFEIYIHLIFGRIL